MLDSLTRDNLAQHVVRDFGRHGPRDARVTLVECDGRRAVLKDVRACSSLFRFTFGRRLIAREFRIYQALDGVPGVPRPGRLLDKDAFLVEYIDGSFLSRRDVRRGIVRLTNETYDACFRLVDELHRRGIVHLDLRNKRNFVFDKDLRPHVVDFASAVRVPRWAPLRPTVIRWLGVFDRAGVLKMKNHLSRALLSDDEKTFLRRFDRTRSILFPCGWLARAIRRWKRAPRRHAK